MLLFSQGYSPEMAVRKMEVADGLQVKLFAAEPEVRQPSLVKVDERGRLWTIQYLQYPNPAGLKRVKMDRWSRTVYDRVPAPPPRGPKGSRPNHNSGGLGWGRPGGSIQGFHPRSESCYRVSRSVTGAFMYCSCPTCCSIRIVIGMTCPTPIQRYC